MKSEVKTPVIVVAAVIIVAILCVVGWKFIGSAGDLDHGQVQYTPGVPPWMEKDPAKKGVAGLGNRTGPQAPPAASTGN